MTPHSGTSSPWPVKHTTSYGGVVVRDGPQGPEVALIRPRGKDRVWALPKGAKEPGEEPEDAALREVAEETGVAAEVIEALEPITYWFSWAPERVRYRKTVHFFLMRPAGSAEKAAHPSGSDELGRHDDEVDEVRFFPLDDAQRQATYDTERRVLRQAAGRARDR